MLQRLIHSARVNVFESARFYYWVLWTLIIYSFFREIIEKFVLVFLERNIKLPKEIMGFFFFIFCLSVFFSIWILKKKVERQYIVFIIGIGLLSLINEIRFVLASINYSLYESLLGGQGHYVVKIVFPIMFLSIWGILDYEKKFTIIFIKNLRFIFLINAAVIIVFGVIMGGDIVESYPLSGRWGYCGFLLNRVETQLIYGLLLIKKFNNINRLSWESLVYLICLLVSGQKAGLLWAFFFFFILYFKGRERVLFGATGIALGALSLKIIPILSLKSVFWRMTLQEHGLWGLVFSTRNELVENFYQNIINPEIIDFLIGGQTRFPADTEILPIDLYLFFGVIGASIFIYFCTWWINSWRWSIPLLIACFAGGLFGYINMTLIFGVFLFSEKT